MKRSLHFSRKYRQFRYLAKSINRSIESGRFETYSLVKQQQLISRLRQLYLRLRAFIAGNKLRKTLAGAALIIGLSQGVQAQNFAPSVPNTFGLSTDVALLFPQAADMDSDGDFDIIAVGNYFGPGLLFFENTGSADAPAFAAEVTNPWSLNPIPYITVLTTADLDGDGDIDIMVGEYDYGDLYYYENIGDPQNPDFGAPVVAPFGLPQFYSFSTPQFGDMDNDGDIDLFVGQGGYDYYTSILYFENIGTPESPEFAAPVENGFGAGDTNFAMIPQLVDIDNDCDLDLAYSDYDYNYNGAISFQENEGTPTAPSFGEVQVGPFGLDSGGGIALMAFADMDGDGDEDLMWTTNYYSDVAYFENISDAVLAADNSILVDENGMYPFAEADFNFDESGGESLSTVMITSLTSVGDLSLNGVPVVAFQEIAVADIPNLVFTPVVDEFGAPYDSFQFKVSDTAGDYSGAIYTMEVDVAEVSSLNVILLEGDFRLSPNPAVDVILLEADLSNLPGSVSIELRNVLGQQLDLMQLDNQQMIRQEIQIDQLAPGSYSLVLRADNGMRAFRFVKN